MKQTIRKSELKRLVEGVINEYYHDGSEESKLWDNMAAHNERFSEPIDSYEEDDYYGDGPDWEPEPTYEKDPNYYWEPMRDWSNFGKQTNYKPGEGIGRGRWNRWNDEMIDYDPDSYKDFINTHLKGGTTLTPAMKKQNDEHDAWQSKEIDDRCRKRDMEDKYGLYRNHQPDAHWGAKDMKGKEAMWAMDDDPFMREIGQSWKGNTSTFEESRNRRLVNQITESVIRRLNGRRVSRRR